MDNNIGEHLIGTTNYRPRALDVKRLLQGLVLGLVVITIGTILQDLIHSQLNGYSFYIFESLLFKAFWFLFLPLLFVQWSWLGKTNTNPVLRTFVAILTPTVGHLLLMPLVISTLSAVFYSHTYSYSQTLKYAISEDIYKLLLIYSFFPILHKYLFARAKFNFEGSAERTSKSFNSSEKTKVVNPLNPQTTALAMLVVSNGRKYTPISVSSILYISAATPYVAIQLENKRFLHNETLRSISEKLDTGQFVRIHKSTIVNLSKVVSFKSRLNGDYDLLLENGTEVRLSRNYGAEFKGRFQARPQVNK